MSFSLRKVKFRYASKDGESNGLDIESLDIQPTGVTAIIGPSGSGKTTLLSVLAGFIAPEIGNRGKLCFQGKPISNKGYRPGEVAFVFQNPMLMGGANGLTNIIQGVVAARSVLSLDDRATAEVTDAAELKKLIKDFGLSNAKSSLLDKRARNLSGGEAQRTSVIRALLSNPQAVLCDEPTSALDEFNAKLVMEALRKWSHDNERPVIWVTHNLEQAVEYADHFVFMSHGHNVEGAEILTSLPNAAKLQALRDVAESLSQMSFSNRPGNRAGRGASASQILHEDGRLQVSPSRYASWIADALSSDGFVSEYFERKHRAALLPRSQIQFLQSFLPGLENVPGILRRQFGRIASYSRYGMALVLFVIFGQILAASFGGLLAKAYSDTKLQDPSVARIVFEHVVEPGGSGDRATPQDLGFDTGLPKIRALLRDAVAQTGSDTERVAVFGRRSVPSSKLQFPDANEKCRDKWLPLPTTALDVDDPLIRQTELVGNDPAFFADPSEIQRLAQSARTRELDGGTESDFERRVLVDTRIVSRLRSDCGLASDRPIEAEWAAGEAGTLNPIHVSIVGSFVHSPPLYPSAPQMIVFEHDYEVAAQKIGIEIEPYRIASAYFPIDGFDVAARTIAAAGYEIRDDSAAAVETLKEIASWARTMPFIVITFNLAAFFIVMVIVVNNQLELNKRVLALFMAHGFRKRDLFRVLFSHTLPAFALAVIGGGGACWGVWSVAIAPRISHELGVTDEMAITEFSKMAAVAVGVFLFSISLSVWAWWRHTRANLKTYLQE